MSTTAEMTSWLGPFGPGFVRTLAENSRRYSGPIEDQQLLLDEHGFGDHRARAAGTGKSGDRHQQMQKKDGQIAHW